MICGVCNIMSYFSTTFLEEALLLGFMVQQGREQTDGAKKDDHWEMLATGLQRDF